MYETVPRIQKFKNIYRPFYLFTRFFPPNSSYDLESPHATSKLLKSLLTTGPLPRPALFTTPSRRSTSLKVLRSITTQARGTSPTATLHHCFTAPICPSYPFWVSLTKRNTPTTNPNWHGDIVYLPLEPRPLSLFKTRKPLHTVAS